MLPASTAQQVLRLVALAAGALLVIVTLHGAWAHWRAHVVSHIDGGLKWRRELKRRHVEPLRWRTASCRAQSAQDFPALPSETAPRPVVVLLWDSHLFHAPSLVPDTLAVSTCPVPCVWLRSLALSCLDEADAVVFSGPHLEREEPLPVYRALAQERVLHATLPESVWAAPLNAARVRELFSMTMTYRLDSDVPASFFVQGSRYVAGPPPPFVGVSLPNASLVSLVESSCAPHSTRNEVVAELLQRMPLHSYGTCFRSAPVPADVLVLPSEEQRTLALMRRHAFHVAIEDVFETDFVTQRFYRCFEAGVLCIYMGAPNVLQFAPGPHSFIHMRDFATLDALAAHVRLVASDTRVYARYFAWREHPDPAFLDLQRTASASAPCRLCHALASRMAAAWDAASREPEM